MAACFNATVGNTRNRENEFSRDVKNRPLPGVDAPYSQYGGESRSFALTHAEGGERSRHCCPLITPATQGDAWREEIEGEGGFSPLFFSSVPLFVSESSVRPT